MSGPLLVTGGTGYLGSELLRRAGDRPLAATWHSHEPAAGGADWHRLDLRDAAAVREAFAAIRPAAVIHTAYKQSGDDARAITVEGARAVAEAARELGAPLVHMSTDVLFDGLKGTPYVEDDPSTPVIDYGRDKADAEQAVLDAHPDALLVRTSLIYSGDGESRHERLALEVARGERDMAFFTDEIRSPAQVSDLAAALLELIDTDLRGILHVAGAQEVSRHEFACVIARANGIEPCGIRAGGIADAGEPRPANCALDSGRARGLLRTKLRGVYDVLAPTDTLRVLVGLDAWSRGDLRGALRTAHPDIEWKAADVLPDISGTYRGYDGVIELWNGLRTAWEHIGIYAERVIEREDEVLAYAHFRARGRGGIELDRPVIWQGRLRDGLLIYAHTWWDRDEAERELGLTGESLAETREPD